MSKLPLKSYIWNPEHETMPSVQLRALQSERLVAVVRHAYEHSPFYRHKLNDVGIHPDTIRSVDDLPKLPFTFKTDLRNHYPFDMFAVPLKEVIRVHTSSGTTGKPTVVGYTKHDIDLWAEMTARALATSGVRPDVAVLNAYNYGVSTGGFGFHYGAERIGATVIPISSSNVKSELMILRDFGVQVILCTPSHALLINEVAAEENIDLCKMPVTSGIFGAEPWSEAMRTEIEAHWGIKAYDTYGMSEVIGPGVAHECPQKNGLHIYEDHFIPEVINPETGEPLPEGKLGELVLTTITKQAVPLIRYRTGDLTRLFYEPCACGRTLVRMERVAGRIDDMITVQGVTILPNQIESVLLQFDDIEPHYQLFVDRSKDEIDSLEVWVESPKAIWQDQSYKNPLEHKLAYEINSTLGIQVQLKLVPPKTIPRSEGKAKRLVENTSKRTTI